MASLQARIAVWIVKHRVKRRLRGVRDYRVAREILRPDPYRVPPSVRVSPGKLNGVPGEWLEGTNPSTAVVLYLHGGGYFACSPESHRPISSSFAMEDFRVFAADYRLAPEHPFPAALDDATAAYRGLLAEGHAPKSIVIVGDSAGGGLALAMMVALRDSGTPLPGAAALFSLWTDLAATGESVRTNNRRCAMFNGPDIGPSARYYLDQAPANTPLASPLYADLKGLPPLLIHVGADEILLDDSTRLGKRARAVGVAVELKIWPVVPHSWQLAPHKIPEARQSLRESAAFLRAHIVHSQGGSEELSAKA